MQFVPNRVKICTVCKQIIRYNEEYLATDYLEADNEVRSICTHMHCSRDGGSWSGSAGPPLLPPLPPPPPVPVNVYPLYPVGTSVYPLYTDGTSKYNTKGIYTIKC